MTDFPASVEAVLDQNTFDVLDFVTGDLTPEDKVVIYTDAKAGYRLDQLIAEENEQAQRADTEGIGIADEVTWIDPDEVAELRERIENSALTFQLKGLAPELKKALRKNLVAKYNYKEGSDFETAEPFFRAYTHELISRSIVSATTAGGKTDKNWSVEKIATLDGRLHPTEFQRLDSAVFQVNADADLFDRAVSADFLSKR